MLSCFPENWFSFPDTRCAQLRRLDRQAGLNELRVCSSLVDMFVYSR